jgi:hypothetical protein
MRQRNKGTVLKEVKSDRISTTSLNLFVSILSGYTEVYSISEIDEEFI